VAWLRLPAVTPVSARLPGALFSSAKIRHAHWNTRKMFRVADMLGETMARKSEHELIVYERKQHRN
jgi:hypothetical protein